MFFEMMGDGQGCAARVEKDRVAIGYELSAGGADPPFFFHLALAPQDQGQLPHPIGSRHRAPMGSNQQLTVGQGLQIRADGDLGDPKAYAQVGHSNPPVLLEESQDRLAAFFEIEVRAGLHRVLVVALYL